jgi:hypothetical protein
VPSAGSSYKQVDEIGPALGGIDEDRYAGIKGRLGAVSSVPVTITSTVAGHTTRARSDVTERYDLATATGMLLATEAQRVLDNGLLGSVKVDWAIDYVRGTGKNAKSGTLRNTDRYAQIDEFPLTLSETGPAEDVAAIVANEFESVRVTAVRMTARFSPDYEATRVSGVQRKVNGAWKSVKAGSALSAVAGKSYDYRAVLTPAPDAANATEYAPFGVHVPKSAKQRLTVDLAGAVAADDDDFWSFLEESDDESDSDGPRDFSQLVAVLDNHERSDNLAITRSYTSTSGKPMSLATTKTTSHVIAGGDFSWTISVTKPAPKKITAGSVKIKGTARIGKKLTVKNSGWKPGGLKYSYQWLANGKTIQKASKQSYTISKKDKGKRLSVKVTAKKTGYTTKSKTSARTKTVTK